MIEEDELLEKEELFFPEKLSDSMIVASKLKGYDKELEIKLPNELRGALKKYDYRNDNDFLTDENDYEYF